VVAARPPPHPHLPRRHWERLEKNWGAQFTDNFRRNTAKLRIASLSAEVAEIGDEFEVSVAIDAGGASLDALKSQLAQGRSYVEHDGAVYLVPPAAVEKLHQAQQALAASLNAPFRPSARQRVARSRAAELQETLENLSPNFRPPEAWRAHSDALRQLTQLAPAPLAADLVATSVRIKTSASPGSGTTTATSRRRPRRLMGHARPPRPPPSPPPCTPKPNRGAAERVTSSAPT
jgi:hypothetical protein